MKKLGISLAALFSFTVSAADIPSTELSSTVNALWEAKAYEQAREQLQPLLKNDRGNPEILALLGQTLAMLGEREDAEELLEKAVKAAPNHPDYQHWYGTLNCSAATSASMFSALGYAKRCKQAYEKALALQPENARNYIALGQFLAQAPGVAGGDKEEPARLAQTLKAIDPLQGWLLALSVTDFSDNDAFNRFIEQADILASRPEPYFARAMQLSQDEHYDESIALLQVAMSRPPVDEDAQDTILESHYQLARIAVMSKRSLDEGVHAMLHYLANAKEESRLEWAKTRLAQLYQLKQADDKMREVATPLFATTSNGDIKKILKKLLK